MKLLLNSFFKKLFKNMLKNSKIFNKNEQKNNKKKAHNFKCEKKTHTLLNIF